MDAELIRAHRDVPQLMPFLHLPVQSGSDAVLEAMNRRYTADDYRRIVDALARGSARSGAVVGLHRRLSRRERRGFRRDHAAGRGDRLRAGLLVQVQRAPGHARVGTAAARARGA